MRISRILLLIGAGLSVACAEAPTALVTAPSGPSLITAGQPDAGRHPYIGLLVFDNEDGPVWPCSGSLLSPTVVLTAAHCTEGMVAARIWMDEVVEGNPEFPFGGATSYEGTPHMNPGFCVGCTPATPGVIWRDVGIVVLSEPVPTQIVREYLQLPAAGLVDALPNKAAIDLVGYGLHEHPRLRTFPPLLARTGMVRHFAPSELVSGNFVNSDEVIRMTLNTAQGKGGLCFGDSGAPNLLGGTNLVIAIASYGVNWSCQGIGYSSRVDIPEVLSWIRSFLE